MMLLDHVAVGALQPQLLAPKQSAHLMMAALLGSVSPDVPILFTGWIGSVAYLSHRSSSHSIFLAPLFALVPALLVHLVLGRRAGARPQVLYLATLLGYIVHLFHDLITPFGTKILYPLSSRPFSLDVLHCLDPAFLGVSALALVATVLNWRSRRVTPRRLASVFALTYLVYFGIALFYKTEHRKRYVDALTRSWPDAVYVRTVPQTFWRWKGIAETAEENIVLVSGPNGVRTKRYRKAAALPAWLGTESDVRRFLSYARFPVIEFTATGAHLHNLVYSPRSYRLVVSRDRATAATTTSLSAFDLRDEDL